jgi:putative endonuclease
VDSGGYQIEMLRWLYRIADRARHRARVRQWAADQALGRRGEDIAHRYLQRLGMTVVARNYRTPGAKAEADLIAWEGETLVIVEVKTRTSAEYGPPERNVGLEKERKVISAGEHYARRADVSMDSLRFDVVSIVIGEPNVVEHFPAAIRPRRWNRQAVAG